ncbi:MAG: hypothetical protein ACI9IA_000125 [Enterobacterales bacterium]
MNQSKEDGIIQVLVDRLVKQRLPRAISLQKKVEAGEMLSDFDVSFLEQVFADVSEIRGVIIDHPEWQPLVAKVMNIYTEIMKKAMINENK